MCCGFLVDEVVCLAGLAGPSMLFNLLEVLLLVVDMMMLGAVGREALAVGALGNAFFNMLWYFTEGVLTAQDNLSSQSFGLRDSEGIRQWMYISLLVVVPLSVIGTTLMIFSPLIVEDLFRLHGDMIAETSLYVILLIPALWFQGLFRVGQKFLLAQHIMKPSVLCILAGFGVNIFLNYMFMFVVDGGAPGCAVSTSITKGCMTIFLVLYLKYSNEYIEMHDLLKVGMFRFLEKHKNELAKLGDKINNNESIQGIRLSPIGSDKGDAMSDQSEASDSGLEMSDQSSHSEVDENNEDTDTLLLSSRGQNNESSGSFSNLFHTKKKILLFLSLGIPGGLVLIVELWTFDIATIVVSQIGNVSVASQSIMILYTTVSYVLIPLSLSIASSVRVSQLLASQNATAAKVSALTCLFLSITICGVLSYLFYTFRDLLGYVFTSDPDIINRCSQLAGIFSLLHFINGIQGTCQGIMRGMNRQRELFGFTFFSYWLFGLPLGIYLTFFTRPRFGLYGLWCGFSTGLGMLALLLAGTVVFTDWEREMRRTQLRIEKHSQSMTPMAWSRPQGGDFVDSRGRLAYLSQASAVPGARALGGFALLDNRSETEELDEYERIEISLAEESSWRVPADSLHPESESRRGLEDDVHNQL